MIGELWRSWGADRPLPFVLDDMAIGCFLLVSALWVGVPTTRRRALFAAAWGFAAGMIYPSFFSKLIGPDDMQAGNWNPDVLTVLVGLAFLISLTGLTASLLLIPADRKVAP